MIRSHKHPVCDALVSPRIAARLLQVLSLATLLFLQLPAQAENEGTDAAPQAEHNASDTPARAEIDDAARQARIANRRAASKANKKPVETEAAAPANRKPIELAALRDDPAPVKTDWQASLGASLAGIGIAGFWIGMGVTNPIVQLSASVGLLILLIFGSKIAIDRLQRRAPARSGNGNDSGGSNNQNRNRNKKVKYAEDLPNSTMMSDDEPGSRPSAPRQTEKPVAKAERAEPSMQAPTRPMSAPAVRSSGGNTIGGPMSRFADTNFAPTSSQQMAARQQALSGSAASPAERAAMAAASAGQAAKAAVNGAPLEDYGSIPANFNVPGFIRKTRLYFIRLQIAWDKSDLQNISEITTSEICEEFRRQVVARGPSDNVTEVLAFEADVLGVKAVGQKYVVTVKMTGIVKESENKVQEAFEEIWRLTRSMTGKENWLLADIKQY
jgi:predicted lipid-binding transport protein (Tim44 family)